MLVIYQLGYQRNGQNMNRCILPFLLPFQITCGPWFSLPSKVLHWSIPPIDAARSPIFFFRPKALCFHHADWDKNFRDVTAVGYDSVSSSAGIAGDHKSEVMLGIVHFPVAG